MTKKVFPRRENLNKDLSKVKEQTKSENKMEKLFSLFYLHLGANTILRILAFCVPYLFFSAVSH